MAKGVHHAPKLALRPLERRSGHQTDDSWHGLRVKFLNARARSSFGDLKPPPVPLPASFSKPGEKRFGKAIHESIVHSQTKGGSPHQGEGDIVPWQVDPPKAVALLEIAEAVRLLLPVG